MLTHGLCAHPRDMSHATSHKHICFMSLGPPKSCTPSPIPGCSPVFLFHIWHHACRFPRVLTHAHNSTCEFHVHSSVPLCACTRPHFRVHTSMRLQKPCFLRLSTHEYSAHGHTCAPHLATRSHNPVSTSLTLGLGPAVLGQAGKLESAKTVPFPSPIPATTRCTVLARAA